MSGASVGALLPVASTAEIVRAALKDEEYISALSSQADALAREVLPNSVRSSQVVSGALSGVIRGLYYALSYRRAPRRTPGDEYVAVLPVRASRGAYAPAGPRAAVVLAVLHGLGRPFAVAFLRAVWRRIARIVRLLRSSERSARPPPFPSHAVDAVLFFVERAHLAAFYIAGVYYCVPNRLLGMRYVRTSAPALHTEIAYNRYQFLGVLVAIQLAGAAIATARATFVRVRRQSQLAADASGLDTAVQYATSSFRALVYPHGSGDGQGEVDSETESSGSDSDDGGRVSRTAATRNGSQHPAGSTAPARPSDATHSSSEREPRHRRRKCPLCLGVLKSPALTSCGHVFCWSCVAGWCATQEMCPLCRQPLQMHKDLFLVSNY